MASTSSSSVQKSFKYDVFLSFRGEDTRKTFIDHLYLALVNRGVITYKDDETIEKGERISDQLLRSIEDSRFYIIVFSKNYASSSWCLDELVKIMECQKTIEHTAYPIFYDVEPTEVRNQIGAVGEAFAKHVKKEAARRWRNALKEAAGLAGWEVKNTVDGHEAKFIQKIVEEVSVKLHFINFSFDEKLVGMETRVKDVVSSLEIGSEDVRMIGIKGIGGGGKTTLARVVFDHISFSFEGKSFVANVREGSKGSGLKNLQKQVLKDVLNDQNIDVTSDYDGAYKMKKMMGGRKVLVVLDDVDDTEQLEALAGATNWFKPGSRIIITTRDEQVLVAHQVNFIHDVNLLSSEEAICLFSKYAFRREIPDQGYEMLSRKVVHYASGLPLTLKVLGSHLCGRKEHEWVDTIERLKIIPLEKTLKRLEISYDGLENDQKEIFLDVVCILKGVSKDYAIRTLESCGFNARIGLRVLEQKSLINMSDTDRLCFHDHIEEMGWNIVRRFHPHEPNRHSRLWIEREIKDVLVNNLGTAETKCIKLDSKLHVATIMKGLRSMKELRILHVKGCFVEEVDGVCEQYLPDTLRTLYWWDYPFCCLPKAFRANKLVNLEMPLSNISHLWEAGQRKVLDKLKFLDLQYSSVTNLNLGMTPHIEKLNLEGCTELVEVHIPVGCPKLKFLNLSSSKVSNLNLGMTPHLEELNLEGCKELVELHIPVGCPKLKFLNLSSSKVSNLNLGMTPHLEELNLEGCKEFVELHIPVGCPKLKFLNLSESKVSNLNLGMTPHLEELTLERCKEFVELHMPVECSNLKILNLCGSKLRKLDLKMTPHLEELTLQGCTEFVKLHLRVECPKLKFLNLSYSKVNYVHLGMFPHLEELRLKGCNELGKLHFPVECPNLKILNLRGTKLRNLNLGMTPHLKKLNLKECKKFVELHLPIECPKLTSLSISDSKVSNLNLGMTPNLKFLYLKGCSYLQEVHAPMGCLKNILDFNLSGCLRFENFWGHNRLMFRFSLARLKLTAKSLDICPLHRNSDMPKFQFRCDYNGALPSSNGNLEKLISFGLCACTNLESFSTTICSLQHLRGLTLKGSIPEVPKDLWQLESLEELTLSMEEIKHLPDSICRLQHLRKLKLHLSIPKVPKDLWRLENLENLTLRMKEIKHLPDSICMLKHLKYLDLESCFFLEKLPQDLGRLEDLEELDLTDCRSLRDIPSSICNMKCLRCLQLPSCILVKELPEQLRHSECLTKGSSFSHLPTSIYESRGLHIFG